MSFSRDVSRAGLRPNIFLFIPFLVLALIFATLGLNVAQFKAAAGSPPMALYFAGLPVMGSLREAHENGFDHCIDFKTTLRCRRTDVMLLGHGPFNAAVDLAGGDGRGGFRQLTLWHGNPNVVTDFSRAMERQGWDSCRTELHNWGDQNILTRPDSPVRFSVDLSYYGQRRIRIIPGQPSPPPKCE